MGWGLRHSPRAVLGWVSPFKRDLSKFLIGQQCHRCPIGGCREHKKCLLVSYMPLASLQVEPLYLCRIRTLATAAL